MSKHRVGAGNGDMSALIRMMDESYNDRDGNTDLFVLAIAAILLGSGWSVETFRAATSDVPNPMYSVAINRIENAMRDSEKGLGNLEAKLDRFERILALVRSLKP